MTDLLKQKIRHVPDFPKAGILFYDITTLLQDPQGFKAAVDSMAGPFQGKGIELVVGIESRGFIFGAAVADRIGAGFSPVRKPGKLPFRVVDESYDLEYGSATLEMHQDSLTGKSRVLVVDDLLATGGTALAAIRLARKVGSEVVGCTFVIELNALKGRERLAPVPCFSLVQYD